MATARDIMHKGAMCVQSDDTVANAARMMAEHDFGAMPICGAEDNKIKGMVTDRDIVVEVIAKGHDPNAYRVDQLPQGHLILCDANEDADAVLAKMSEHQVKRLPVIDDHRLVGIISLADVARNLPEPDVGELVEALSMSNTG
jgi:CBS domain-containing protein